MEKNQVIQHCITSSKGANLEDTGEKLVKCGCINTECDNTTW